MQYRRLNRIIGKILPSPLLPGALTLLVLLAGAPSAHAEISGGWGWWLPPNHSVHGDAMDAIFLWIFWITTIVMIAVEGTMVYFLIKYRDRGDRKKAKFIHGNTRLEMVWTLIPAVIFAVIALASKRVWETYRYATPEPNEAEILVVGEQFKWNVVYPGPDGKLGDYLVFPQPTDPKFRIYNFKDAVKNINKYILQENPLGQDLMGPNADYARDDDYDHQPGRPVIIPCGRQVRVYISSKDVIHDFYLPNFRVKLDAVPGMRGHIDMTTKPDCQSTQTLPIDDPQLIGKVAWVSPATTPNAAYDKRLKNYYLPDPKDPTSGTKGLVHSLVDRFDAGMIAKCKAAGTTHLTAVTKPYEVVCEELCGALHTTMKAEFLVVSSQEYDDFVNKGAAPPATKPANVAMAQ